MPLNLFILRTRAVFDRCGGRVSKWNWPILPNSTCIMVAKDSLDMPIGGNNVIEETTRPNNVIT